MLCLCQGSVDVRLGDLEELILLAILGLEDQAYGAAIHQRLEAAGRSIFAGALYTTLDRMESKGLLASFKGKVTAERGGRAQTYYHPTDVGLKALERVETVRNQLRIGLSQISIPSSAQRMRAMQEERAIEAVHKPSQLKKQAHNSLKGRNQRASANETVTKPLAKNGLAKDSSTQSSVKPTTKTDETASSSNPKPAFPSVFDSF